MKNDDFDTITVNIPKFLIKEIEKDIEKEGAKPNLSKITVKVNEAIITSLCFDRDSLNDTLKKYFENIKNCFYNVSYLLAKNLSIELLKKSGKEIDKDEIDEKARLIALNCCSRMLSVGEDERIIKRENLVEKYNKLRNGLGE